MIWAAVRLCEGLGETDRDVDNFGDTDRDIDNKGDIDRDSDGNNKHEETFLSQREMERLNQKPGRVQEEWRTGTDQPE